MNPLHGCVYLSQLLFLLIPVCEGSLQTLIRKTGELVTLPCRYDVKANGLAEMCWGRAEVPMSGCSSTIIETDGEKVTFSGSRRYWLLSGVRRGDVSLTIINVTEEDSGIYGCRVDFQGLFNDLIINFNLTILKAGNQRTTLFMATENTPGKASVGENTPGKARAGEKTTPSVDTGNSDLVTFQAQDMSQTFNGNVIRIGAVIFITVLIGLVILVLMSRRKKHRSMQLDHSAPIVQIRN